MTDKAVIILDITLLFTLRDKVALGALNNKCCFRGDGLVKHKLSFVKTGTRQRHH